ncbi:DUF2752 domain-containing protein [Lentzea sp. BCCO 10_0061]|uniref:DUF2752 domain-containing protein n=1 Tax=Lentzea sokolovensis TaxID=3095429 RepID=A0ABU4UWM7_9PSEU|nr:DUF2752 domain-containing protein [Lentzea sp. BCCO 10_0061]MDX8143193.1 DUF2752 domain-containing protein [Lentzea sp. BCCO 10_0061]
MTSRDRDLRIGWSDHDRAAWCTKAAVLFGVAAVALRIVGVPPVDLHGPLHYLGVMDPLCGGTRATFLLLSGDLAEAARYNPIVFPLAAVAVLVFARAVVGMTTRRWLDVQLGRMSRIAAWTALALALVLLEVRQQLNADLLMQAWPA